MHIFLQFCKTLAKMDFFCVFYKLLTKWWILDLQLKVENFCDL